MKNRSLEIRFDKDGYRVVSTDGTEYWDIDGPFETEEEAAKSMQFHQAEWEQSHPDEE